MASRGLYCIPHDQHHGIFPCKYCEESAMTTQPSEPVTREQCIAFVEQLLSPQGNMEWNAYGYAHLDAVLAHLRTPAPSVAQVARCEWQPAITAPDDESLLLSVDNVGVVVGFKAVAGEQYWWCYEGGRSIEVNDAIVTHWMPLPA